MTAPKKACSCNPLSHGRLDDCPCHCHRPPDRDAQAIQRVRELLPRIEGVIEFDMAGERYDAVMSVQQVLEHLRRALDGA